MKSHITKWKTWFTGLMLASALSPTNPAQGQVIPNPSFETDNFTVSPGYISGNTPITGWTGSPADRVGINPASGSPFADNGTIPNGSKVAFIQSSTGGPSSLSTEITELSAGTKYLVNFRFNARNTQTPYLKIGVDGQPIVGLYVSSVGGTAAYKYAAFEFTAATNTAILSLTNDVSGDTTVLVDDFSIRVSDTGWSYAPWNDDATFGLDSTKAVTHAYNFGGGAAPDVVINGVTFKGLVGTTPTVANEFRATLGSAFSNDDANNISGDSAVLSKRFAYGGNPGAFTIAGLVPGREYVATFYAVGWGDASIGFLRSQTFAFGNDRLTVNQDQFGENNGIRIMYRYIAPASGAVQLSQWPAHSNNSLHLNGFSNYEVPAPGEPVVGVQPRSQITTPGATVSFKITAGGARPLSYQWYNGEILLVDQTNRWLTVSNLTVADVGPFYVVIANTFGTATSSSAGLTFGQIANPSFEADLFDNYPGYISGNLPISGWVASDAARIGINPQSDGLTTPFANNGTVPDGRQVALIQYASGAGVTLSTPITSLVPGETYFLNFQANARDYNTTRPTLGVGIDGALIGQLRLSPVGGTSPYRPVALPFVPATETVQLVLTNYTTDSALVDNFSVTARTSSWQYAAWNDDASAGVDAASGYSHAVSFGGAGLAVDTVINGIRFQGVPGANPAVENSFYATNFTAAFGGDANTVTTNGGGSALLAQSFIYHAGTAPADAAQTIALTNLIPGVEYEATIFGVGWDATAYGRSSTFVVGEDARTINEDAFDNNNGIRVTYRYVADASGAITLKYWATDRASTFHTYGMANREVNSTQVPNLYRQPVGRTVAGGATVVMDGLAGGQTPLRFQWQKDGVDLPDQTNAVLTLANVDGSTTGGYTLIVSNALGAVTSQVAVVEVGLSMVNPSFEVDVFTNYPGYVSGNFPITGWTSSVPEQTGINPANGSPFANNGVIPDGAKVAFIQANDAVLSQVVGGMVPGTTYFLKFFENSRSGYPAPNLAVTLGGNPIVPAHTVPSGAYRQVVSGPFLATTDSAELAFIKTAGPAAGDSAVLIDSVAVLELPPTAPAFLAEPDSLFIKQGELVTLNAQVQGTLPMSFQWQLNGVDLPDATNATLELPAIAFNQGGEYQLIATNTLGASTSRVAVVRVGLGFSELYNTGVADSEELAEGGLVDAHYRLVTSADPEYAGPEIYILNDVWPATNGVYLTNGPLSKWVSPRLIDPGLMLGNVPGVYVFRTHFLLDMVNPTDAVLTGRWAVDDAVNDVVLNGVSLGLTNTTAYAVFGQFAVTNGFVPGVNTLDFVVTNGAAGPLALRVEMDSVAPPLVDVPPQWVEQPVDVRAVEMQAATFSALAIGSGPLVYQWYLEGFPLDGATNRVLTLPAASFDFEGTYTVKVTGSAGELTSEEARLTVLSLPLVLTEPASVTVPRGSNATFEISVFSPIPETYQWLYGDQALEGQTNATLALTSVTPAQRGDYRVIVSNEAGSVTSAVAVLTVPNSAPVAPVVQLQIAPDGSLVLALADLLAGATDADGDPITLVEVAATSTNGVTVVLTETNLTYAPAVGFVGVDRLTFTVTDGYDATASEVVVMVMTGPIPPVNTVVITDAGQAFALRFAGEPGRSYEFQRAENVNGQWQTLDTQTAPDHGILDFLDATPPEGRAFYRVISPAP